MATKKRSRYSNILLTAFAVILFWRGAWGLMDIYVFPENEILSYVISLLLGVAIFKWTHHSFEDLF